MVVVTADAILARADHLERVHAALALFWAQLDQLLPADVGADFSLRFAAAVAEIAANLVEHAGLGDDTFDLLLSAYPDRVEAEFTDRGIPFKEPEATPSSGVDVELAEGGYGLALARAAVDIVTYQRTSAGINRWRLIKKFEPSAQRLGGEHIGLPG